MKKCIKFSFITLGIGIALISFCELKRHYHDRIEDQILKRMLAKYQGCPVKGTWIQQHGNHYVCEITVMTDHHQWQHHQFRTDQDGDLMLNN